MSHNPHKIGILEYFSVRGPKAVARFESYIDKSPHPKGCWEWRGRHNGKTPRPQFALRLNDKSNYSQFVYRISWVLHYKMEIPDGLCICHACDNPRCVNWKHLWLGSLQHNMLDARLKGILVGGGVKKTPLKKRLKYADLYIGGMTSAKIAKRFKVTQVHIANVFRDRDVVEHYGESPIEIKKRLLHEQGKPARGKLSYRYGSSQLPK